MFPKQGKQAKEVSNIPSASEGEVGGKGRSEGKAMTMVGLGGPFPDLSGKLGCLVGRC